jgi:hypothetical protein
MCNYDFKWIEKPKGDWDWVNRVFRELGHYYNKFIENIAEIPFNYSERSIVGHIAIAAHECGYYTLQDYGTKIEGESQGEKAKYRYPDLWLTREPEKIGDHLFEAKRPNDKSIDKIDIEDLKTSVCNTIKEVHDKFDKDKTPRNEKVKYQCALVFIQLRCGKKQWVKYGANSNSYDGILKKLIKDINNKNNWHDGTFKPNFWFYYWIPFCEIKEGHYQPLEKYYWKEQDQRKQYRNPSLGVLIFGSFRKIT